MITKTIDIQFNIFRLSIKAEEFVVGNVIFEHFLANQLIATDIFFLPRKIIIVYF